MACLILYIYAIEPVMISSTLIIHLTGQNWLCKGHRPLLTGVTWFSLGYREIWKIVDQLWSQFLKKAPRNWTRPDLKALAQTGYRPREQLAICP
jgi:hypothetical protein